MPRYRVFDIEYDTGGCAIDELPKELFITADDVDFDPAEDLADSISDQTGFCVFGYAFEQVDG